MEVYKTIVRKSTGEYIHYMDGILYGCSRPKLIADDASLEDLKRIARDYDDTDLDISDLEIKEVELIIKT